MSPDNWFWLVVEVLWVAVLVLAWYVTRGPDRQR